MTGQELRGLFWGIIGVASFSLTLPATRVAALPLGIGFVSFGRAIGAALLAAIILLVVRPPLPDRKDLGLLTLVVGGVVFGFPFLTTFAMAHTTASHGAIIVGLLPLSTAVAGVFLNHERPSTGFWIASAVGTLILLAFILQRSEGGVSLADLALVGADIAAACGYAAGGRLASRLGSWQVICWALVISLPVLLLAAPFFVTWPEFNVPWQTIWPAWAGFIYVMLVSQLVGFFAWYHGLRIGGVARVSQTQLLQLFMTLIVSAWLLGEAVEPDLWLYGAAVVAAVAIGTRLRVERRPVPVSASS